MPIAQPNMGLETAVSKEVFYPLHSAQLLHIRRANAVRLRQSGYRIFGRLLLQTEGSYARSQGTF